MEQLSSHGTDFLWNSTLGAFFKICRENASLVEIWQKTSVSLHQELCTCVTRVADFVLEWENFYVKVLEEIKSDFSCQIHFLHNCSVYEISKNTPALGDETQCGEKICDFYAGQLRQKYTVVILNTYCFIFEYNYTILWHHPKQLDVFCGVT